MPKIRFCLILSCLYMQFFQLNGQATTASEILQIGKPCPPILLTNISYYSKTSATLNDFKGKWLILDFWNRYCTACVASFPETNELQRQYNENIQFILVGYSGSQYSHSSDEKAIKILYEKFRQRLHLQLPIIYDSILFRKFDIGACPYIVVIDDSGFVRGITYKLNKDDISGYLQRKNSAKSLTMNIHQKEAFNALFDNKKPFLLNQNGGNDTNYIFRSVLAHFNNELPTSIPYSIFSLADHGRFQVLGAMAEQLYRYAFTGFYNITYDNPLYGDFSNQILYEDSLGHARNDFIDGGKQYSYSISAPSKIHDTVGFQKMIQRDLQNYFNLDASVEIRKLPYFKLSATETAKEKLATAGNKPALTSNPAEITMVNLPVTTLLQGLAAFYPSFPPFIDETGISGNIDLSLKTIITDFQSLKKSLGAHGLLLSEAQKEMKVIVIRQPAVKD